MKRVAAATTRSRRHATGFPATCGGQSNFRGGTPHEPHFCFTFGEYHS